MGNRVKRFKTSVSDADMAQAISSAWQKLFGEVPSKEQVAMVLAQNSLETGHRNSMWNYNVGNITTSASGPYNYFDDLTTSEQVSPGKWEKKNLKYRAYSSLEEGVLDYLRFLSKSKNYQAAWQHVINPNPEEFSKALKRAGYYTANEAPYTKAITQLFNQYSKSDKLTPGSAPKIKAPMSDIKNEYADLIREHMRQQKGKESDVFNQLIQQTQTPKPVATAPQQTKPLAATPFKMTPEIDKLLSGFLSQVKASEKLNKDLYRRFLPEQNLLIKIESRDPVDAIEFSRVLCTALDEELLARAYACGDNKHVEVECKIYGPQQECVEAVKQLTSALAETFKYATRKIGGVDIKTNVIMNKKSSYQQISVKTAELSYRKFRFKFS